MSDDLLTTLRFEVDGSGIATGLTSVKRSIADLGNAVKDITDKTNAALGKVGTEELPVAKGLEKASKSIIKQTGDIEKAIATFGTTASTSLKQAYKDINAEEVRLRGMGIDAAIMNPYIEKLREVQKLTAAVAAQERTLAQGAAQAVEAENQRLAHTLELKRQIANVKTTVDKNNAAAQAAHQAEIEAQQKLKLLDINNKIQAAQRAAADAQSAQAAAQSAQQAEAKAQHQMRLLALNNQIQASNKATADAQAAQSAKAIKDLKDLTAAQAAYRQEVINSELNFTHTGRGKSTAFLADKGQRLGFDSSFIEKELAGYKKVEDAAKAAFQAANPHIAEMSKRAADAGTSVKGLSASLRNVPAQFTDIVVSLQGGQAPLTVLLQQGGQLKDLFGGVGNAARALGGYVVGLINPFTVAAGVVGTLGLAYFKGAAEAEAYNSALINTGNAAGVTAGQLGNMAKAVAQATGGTVGAAAEALAGLAGTSGIAASQFEKIAAVAVQMEKVTGVAVADTVKQFAELGKDPVGASLKLTESTKYLTAEVYEQIRALVEQGKTVEAGTVAQNALADVMKKRIPELVDNLGYLESGWKNVAGAAKGAWDFMAGIGRPGPTMAQKIAEQIAELEQLTAPGRGIFAGRSKEQDKELANLRMQAEYWAGIEKSKADAAALDAARIKQEEASIRLSETAYKNEKDRTVLMERERAKVKADYEASAKSLRDRENYEKAIAQIKERYKEKATATTKTKSGDEFASQRDAAKEWAGYMERFGNMADKSTAEVDGLNKAQAELVKYLSSTAYTQMDEPARQLALQSAYAAIAIEQQADATKALNKAQEALEKERTSAIQSHVKEIDSINDKAQKLEDEVAAYVQSKEAIEALTTARMLDRIEVLKGFDGSSEEIARIEKTIAARKRLAAAGAAKDQKIANEKAAEDAAKEWQKSADKINDSITDALMRGFESGKGFAENLRDSVVNMFKTMVLRPVVQATVGGTLGVLGMNAAAQPADSGGVGGLLNTASDLKTLYGMKDWFTDFGSAAASSVIRGGEIAYSAGFEKIGSSMMSVSEAGNFAAVSDGLNTLGSGLSYFSAAVSASQGKWGSAAGTVIGTAFGGPLGGAVGSFLGGLVDNIFGGDGGPKLASTGDAIRRYDKGGALTENATNGAWFFTNTDDANKLLDGLESRYQKAAKALGIGTVATQFDYGSNNRGNFALAGAAGNSRANTGEIAYSAEAMQVAASRAVFAALQGSELPKYLSGLLDSVGDINAMSQTQIDDLLNTAQAFKGLHDVMVQMPFDALHDLSYDAAKGLIEFSGGLDKLTQNLGTYYENFYSAEEKKAQTLKNITQTLTDAGALTRTTRTAIPGEHDLVYGPTGMSVSLEQRYATIVENLDMPKTREEFRALVESMKDLGGESAQKAYAALLSVSGAFASIVPAAADLNKALSEIASERSSLQSELDSLTMTSTQLLDKQRAALDESNRGLFDQVQAQLQLKDAADKAAASAKETAALQIELLTAQGNTQGAAEALRALETQGFGAVEVAAYDLNAGLRETINTLNATAEAARNAAASQTSLAAKYANPLTVTTASALLPTGIADSLLAQGPTQIRDTISNYIKALDPLTESGRAAIAQVEGLSSALDVLVGEVDRVSSQSAAQAQASAEAYRAQLQANADSAAQAVQGAFDGVVSSVNSLKDAATALYKSQGDAIRDQKSLVAASISGLSNLSSKLKSTYNGMELAGSETATRQLAQATLSQLLATARTTGVLPTSGLPAEQLDRALGAVSRPSEDLFSSYAEYAFDFLKTANDVKSLGELSDAQLSAQELMQRTMDDQLTMLEKSYKAQIDTLDDTLASAQRQVDALNGVRVGIDSLGVSMQNLAGAIAAAQIAKAAASSAGAAVATATTTASASTGSSSQAYIPPPIYTAAADPLALEKRGTTNTAFWRIGDLSYDGVGNAYTAYGPGSANFGAFANSAALEAANNWPKGVINKWAQLNSLPAFAQGINYVPEDMTARIHKGEAVVPAAYNPFNPNAQGAGNARLEKLVEGLTAEVQRLQSIVNDGNTIGRRTADAVNGNPEMPMLVETV